MIADAIVVSLTTQTTSDSQSVYQSGTTTDADSGGNRPSGAPSRSRA